MKKTAKIILLLFGVGTVITCGNLINTEVDYNTEQAWQRNFKEALLEGYTDFKSHCVNVDFAVYIFSYTYPATSYKMSSDVIDTLKTQLVRDYTVVSECSNELVLQRSIWYSKCNGFDEYRFLINQKLKRITVMFANLDSRVELMDHEKLVDRLYSIHQSH